MLHESNPPDNLSQPVSSGGAVEPAAPVDAAAVVEQQLDGLENRLADLHRQVQQLQRLASLGTISAILAHEFNNLLTPMLSYSQYALTRDDPALMKTAVEKSFQAAERLSVLCKKILGLARDDSMGPVDTEIRPLLVDTVECIGRDLNKDRIVFEIDAPEDLKARAHPSSLQQVLFNLVLNARQAMLDRPGTLTLSARATGDGKIEIAVRDTGHGIKPEHIDRIFDSFFSTRQHESKIDRRGIGLGLHICRQLMEEQNGDIGVLSKVGEGTTFTLTLPGVD